MRPRIAALLLSLIILAAPAAALAGKPDTIVFSPDVLAASWTRAAQRDPKIMKAYKQLIREADRALKAKIERVTDKPAHGPSKDPRDYWSLSPYWWPAPDSPTGLPYVRRDGERNPEADSEHFDRARMKRMSHNVLTLAQAWFLTENEVYAQRCALQLRAWFTDRTTRMNPTLQYAQSRPGIEEPQHSGIIEGKDLIRVADAVRLLEPSRAWTRADSHKIEAWFGEYVNWLMRSEAGRDEAASLNNHGTWFDAQVAVFALFSGDANLAGQVIGSAGRRRVVTQIMPDGTMPRELERTRSRHYTFFNLEGLSVLACVGERLGLDLWDWQSQTGQSLRKALDTAAPHLSPEAPWPHGPTGEFAPLPFVWMLRRAAAAYEDPTLLAPLDGLPRDRVQSHRSLLFH